MSNLVSELKRRNVFRVGAAYALVGWLVAQAGDLAADNLSFPDWFMPMLLVGLVLGFPVALFFAWAFELTPKGVMKTEDVDMDTSITPSTGKRLNAFIIGALALAVVLLVADRLSSTNEPDAQTSDSTESSSAIDNALEKSIAVLPFSNLSNDASTDGFVSGLHDDLLTQLSKINDLKVISRTSVLKYAGTVHNIKDIAAELGVATVMEGGVQRSGDRVRINVQLIDSTTDEHLWAETYDRVLTTENVFDMQSEITRQIATALTSALTPAEEARLDNRPTDNLAAYEAYLNAKLLENRYSNLGENVLEEAVAAARLAVELDPEFAGAWAMLAQVHLSRFWYLSRNPEDAAAAWSAIGRARALDPHATEVGLMLGLYHYWVNFDYDAAVFELDRVLSAESGNGQAWAIRGWAVRRAGRWDEALDAMRKAAALDPNSIGHILEVADTLLVLRRYKEAQTWINKAASRFPDSIQMATKRGSLALVSKGDSEPQTAAYRELSQLDNPDIVERMYYVIYEANFGEPQRGLDYLNQWAPGTIDVQYNYWPEDLLRAYAVYAMGQSAAASELAAQALPLIEAAQRLEPNEVDIALAKAYAYALTGQADNALSSAQQVRDIYPRSFDDWGGAAYLIAAIETLAIAGHYDVALEWLDEYLSGTGGILSLGAIRENRIYAAVINEPGFAALVEKHGLIPEDQSPRATTSGRF